MSPGDALPNSNTSRDATRLLAGTGLFAAIACSTIGWLAVRISELESATLQALNSQEETSRRAEALYNRREDLDRPHWRMTTFPDVAADRKVLANPADNGRGALPLIDAPWRGMPHYSVTLEEFRKGSARSGDAGAAGSTEPATAARRAIAAMFATSALVIAGAGAVMIFMLQFGLARPIAGLTAAIELALADPSDPPLPGLNRRDELGRIARVFERMRAAAVAQTINHADEIAQRLRDAAAAEAAAQSARDLAAHGHSLAVTRIAEALGALAGGDLNGSISEVLSGDYAQVSADFNRATAVLAGAMRAVSSSTQAIGFCARDMSTASDDMSQRAQAQASIAEETAESIARLAIDVEAVAEDAEPLRRSAAAIDMQTKASSAALGEAARELQAFTRLVQQLNLNIGLIDEIAVHTNLLAINAGVEAARAGEAGRGTAVVASEMRAVAQRSAQAAKELKDLFKTSLGHARGGFERIEYAGETLAQLATQTADIDEKAKAFRAGAAGRSATVNAIRENLDRIATMAQSHADTALAVASASDSLDQRIDRLLFLFGRFRFGENQSPEPTSALQLRAPEAESTTWATRARASPRKATDNSASSAA